MITASVTILKCLRNRSSIYYRPKAFVNISGMIYRMKQNGAGLASICILSTMVLVTISATAGLFIGQEAGVRDRNPVDIKLTAQKSDENLDDAIVELAQQNTVTVDKLFYLEGSSYFPVMNQSEGAFTPASGQDFANQNQDTNDIFLATIELISLKDYNAISGTHEKLQEDEILVFSRSGRFPGESISIGNQSFTVVKELESLPFSSKTEEENMNNHTIIMKNEQIIQQVIEGVNQEVNSQDTTMTKAVFGSVVMANLSGTQENRMRFTNQLSSYVDSLNEETVAQNLPNQNSRYLSFSSIDEDRASTLMLNGGFLFIGILFSLSFAVATALIIYYKQISEGYEDAYRFEVMQKVGMSHKEVKKTIQSQILMVFLFPIALQVVHLFFAAPIIQKILVMFGFNDNHLFLWVMLISVGLFSLCYLLVYMQTSKVYYRLVERLN